MEAIALADEAVLRELRALTARVDELERRLDELTAANSPRSKAARAAKPTKAERVAARKKARETGSSAKES